jgi:hypothetical protein
LPETIVCWGDAKEQEKKLDAADLVEFARPFPADSGLREVRASEKVRTELVEIPIWQIGPAASEGRNGR